MKEVVVNFQELINKINPVATQSSFSSRPEALGNPEILEEFALSSGTLQSAAPKIASVFSDREYWSLYENDKLLEPLKFSNGKTQEDVVREVCDLIKGGTRVVFIRGVCGTGKSAIALNVARKLGKTSIIVPVKALQKQYDADYAKRKYLLKSSGAPLKIAMITGRDNHPSPLRPGKTCNDPTLPELIKITEKNVHEIREYYFQNPFIENKSNPIIDDLKRSSIAPANPYWSPIAPAHLELNLRDAKKKRYRGLNGNDFIFYHRKHGCSYYDQYQAYLDADVIIFNAAKYKIECALNRKPETEVDIIDEADEFLDSFAQQETINLTRLANTLHASNTLDADTNQTIDSIRDLLKLEEKNKSALGINENDIIQVSNTRLYKVLKLLAEAGSLEEELNLDETSYISHALEVAREFHEFLDQTYVSFRRENTDLLASFVTTNISQRFHDLADKNKALILMSGTLHTKEVIEKVFGIKSYKVVEAETQTPGTIEIIRTGKEFDCKFSNFGQGEGKYTREHYLNALNAAIAKAKRPLLVHVNAFEDLPAIEELYRYELKGIISREELKEAQLNDPDGVRVETFKTKQTNILFTTKCARGIDFPGEVCNSLVFTKFPNPNPREAFWKALQQTHPNSFWDVYKDKARREFLQRLYRALRSPDDHVFVLSPDIRVINTIQALQRNN